MSVFTGAALVSIIAIGVVMKVVIMKLIRDELVKLKD
ncbi:MAG: hypothetical protein QOG15_3273 [Solirubrobacteraceae bacterium]|jgi:hypothetical protein|nr:hypothetical protein [Solirubrobacteraceae bacterium]